MNFAPFTGQPAAGAAPAVHQFAAKFGYEGERYAAATGAQLAPAADRFRPESVVVVSSAPAGAVTLAGIAPIHTVNTGVKYQSLSAVNVNVGVGVGVGYPGYVELKDGKRERDELPDLMATVMQQQVAPVPLQQGAQQLLLVLHEPKEAALARAVKQEARAAAAPAHAHAEFISIGDVSDASWLGGGVGEYLSALPLPLHHLLKYSDKRDEPLVVALPGAPPPLAPMNTNPPVASVAAEAPSQPPPAPPKRKKKKKVAKEKKPRPKPGEIRLTTALDGSTLYCCPECHMAYPERGLLEQHLVGHTMERRFICDICNAALKRKDHLTRHKQSHNPERPHACAVCLKAFKRKEQLTLHFVIHSGEKRHICSECGKGFYRKDHLRKHTRSHIARRVKAELSQTAPEPS